MKVFNLSVGTIIARFYLMMLIVIAAGFLGQWWLAVLAFPVFLSIMFGLTFGKDKPETPVKQMDNQTAQSVKKAG